MRVSFLFHLYQPSFQSETVFRDIFNRSYNPLFKLLKSHKNFEATLNIPLSLLELMDKYDCTSWMESIKDLVQTEQIELTGSAAYHSLLTRVSHIVAEKQIILNEYGLGYYFGRRSGFEGEPSVLIKDLNGFFPPELSVSANVVKLLDSMGYNWTIVDEPAIPNLSKDTIYTLENTNIKIVPREKNLSNMISFKRDSNFQDVWQYMKNSGKENFIIALDGEAFGHHFANGISWLESFIDYLFEQGVTFSTVTNTLDYMTESDIEHISESSWGATEHELTEGNIYPMWNAPNNKTHELQWKILNQLDTLISDRHKTSNISEESYESIPLWKLDNSDDPILTAVKKEIQLQKLFNSDQFWWASKKVMPKGELLFDKGILLGIINDYRNYLSDLDSEYDSKKIQHINTELEALEKLLSEE